VGLVPLGQIFFVLVQLVQSRCPHVSDDFLVALVVVLFFPVGDVFLPQKFVLESHQFFFDSEIFFAHSFGLAALVDVESAHCHLHTVVDARARGLLAEGVADFEQKLFRVAEFPPLDRTHNVFVEWNLDLVE
jgi:hypothetical protein